MTSLTFIESAILVCTSAAFFFTLATFFLRIFCRKKGDYDAEAFLSVGQTIGHVALAICVGLFFVVKGIHFAVFGGA